MKTKEILRIAKELKLDKEETMSLVFSYIFSNVPEIPDEELNFISIAVICTATIIGFIKGAYSK